MESTAGVPHVQISRVASIIATRLCDYLASPAFEAQTLVGTKTRLVIQGHLQSSTSVNQRIIDLGAIGWDDIVPLLHLDEHQPSTDTLLNPQVQSQRPREDEQAPRPRLLLTLPKSPSENPHRPDIDQPNTKRRKVVGGLRPIPSSFKGKVSTVNATPEGTHEPAERDCASDPKISRQLQSGVRQLPQRKNPMAARTSQTPRSTTTVIASIWRTIYGPVTIDPTATFADNDAFLLSTQHNSRMDHDTFAQINAICLKATTLSKSARALEVVVQANWVDSYDARIRVIGEENPRLSSTETRMAALAEACTTLGWTQKALRNRMIIWRGYKDIKDSGGWVSLVFAGSGIYSTCKYHIGFDDGLLQRLKRIKMSLEVAADTLHPRWRQLLYPVGVCTQRRYTDHPHDWVVDGEKKAIPLATTYRQWDPDFTFQHLERCTIDDCWSGQDPRRVYTGDTFMCLHCGERQSEDLENNRCECFPILTATTRCMAAPVQVARCQNGKNNGLFARCAFERGMAVGEFVGLVTNGIEGVDVMMGGNGDGQYQIYQGRVGNYTRFVNHSCAPNAQFTKFVFCGIERIIVVSKGIEAGAEITVDYSPSYWTELDKVCLCGESCCRYSRK